MLGRLFSLYRQSLRVDTRQIVREAGIGGLTLWGFEHGHTSVSDVQFARMLSAMGKTFDQFCDEVRAAGGEAWDGINVEDELAKVRGVCQGTEAAVCDDIYRRQQAGIQKYGKIVAGNPLNLRQWLQHAYEEALDLAIYLKRSMEEIDSAK